MKKNIHLLYVPLLLLMMLLVQCQPAEVVDAGEPDLAYQEAREALSEGNDAALIAAQRALRKAQQADDKLYQAKAWYLIGYIYGNQNNHKEAYYATQNSNTLFTTVEDWAGVARCEVSLSTLYYEVGSLDKAEARLAKAEALLANEGVDNDLRVYVLKGYAELLTARGQTEEALAKTLAYYPLLKDTDDVATEITTLHALALLHDDLGRLEESESYFKQALALFESRKPATIANYEVGILRNYGLLLLDMNRPEEALRCMQLAHRKSFGMKDLGMQIRAINTLASRYMQTDNKQRALTILRGVEGITKRSESAQEDVATAYGLMGKICLQLMRNEEASVYFDKQEQLLKEIANRPEKSKQFEARQAVFEAEQRIEHERSASMDSRYENYLRLALMTLALLCLFTLGNALWYNFRLRRLKTSLQELAGQQSNR